MREKAKALDQQDPLKEFCTRFVLPNDKIYLCSNSLGLPVKQSFTAMQTQMQKWANQGAQAWFAGDDCWYTAFDRDMRQHLSQVLGAHEDEVIVMNSLTINLHLLLTSFYRPSSSRFKIVIDEPAFPSDLYAIKSHIQWHGLDPDSVLISLKPRANESILRFEDIEQVIMQGGECIALVFLNAVNYLTGQALDIQSVAKLAQQKGCMVGIDVAHAAGNIPLYLHDCQVDFAVGCSYKYLCSGPGGPGIAFVHAKHHDKAFLRLAGWWGNDPATRFQMDKLSEFIPHGGAASWQVSTPSILSMQPLLASLQVFVEAGMVNVRKKSLLQTDFLLALLADVEGNYKIITPLSVARGNQISIQLSQPANDFSQLLYDGGFICDFRPYNILRVAASPLYNSFQDIYDFVMCFRKIISII